MTSKEALKRLWQETAPATYMKDFNKKECCDAIAKDLEVLEILKRQYKGRIDGEEKEFTDEEVEKITEWLQNDKG